MTGAGELAPGTYVVGLQIIRPLRAGGFGVVHQAMQNGKMVAVKVALHREESGDIGMTYARALREVHLLLRARHPHLIKVLGFGHLPDGRVYIVLEYVDGWTLGEWLERTHPTFQELARVFVAIADAMDYLLSQGIHHRDLKLPNVMIRKSDQQPVIIDLGCATYTGAEELTTTPLPPGTERYRAPEALAFLARWRRKQQERYVAQAADELFAVGVMLFDLLTDPLPTQDHPRPDLASSLSRLMSPRALNPRVPVAFSALVEELIAHDPKQRPESFKVLRRRLQELAEHEEPEVKEMIHSPSAQRRRVPVNEVKPTQRVAPTKRNWRRVLTLVGLGVVVVLAAGAVAWRGHGQRSRLWVSVDSSTGPAHASAPAQDSAPIAPAIEPKEGSTVKLQPPDALSSAPTLLTPNAAVETEALDSPVWCKVLPLTVALTLGCSSVPIRPPKHFDCSPGAQDAMKRLGWDSVTDFDIQLDERGSVDAGWYYFTPGPVVGVGLGGEKVPEESRFYGNIYIKEKTARFPLGTVIAIYDHVDIPGRGKFPICLETVANPVLEEKDGTFKAMMAVGAYIIGVPF